MNTLVSIPERRSTSVDKPGAPSEPELLQRDLATAGEVFFALQQAISSTDLQVISTALGRGGNLLDDDGQRDLLATADSLGRPVTRKQIAGQVAILVASFPQAGKLDQAFPKILCEDIAAAEPSIGALAESIRTVRRNWKPDFGKIFPSIAEILEAIATVETSNANRRRRITELPALLDRVREHRERLLAARRRWEAETKEKIRAALRFKAWEADKSGWESPRPPEAYIHPDWPRPLVDEVRAEMAAEERADV